jgi:hypothetical protein
MALSLLMTGCASLRHQSALYEEAQRHIYSRPIEEVWPHLVQFVSAEGYPHRKGNQDFVLISEWRNDTQVSRVVSSVSRIYAQGYRVDEGRSMVRIFRVTVFTGNKGPMSLSENQRSSKLMAAPGGGPGSFLRDGELEWKLLQRLDELSAASIEARVTEREKAVAARHASAPP